MKTNSESGIRLAKIFTVGFPVALFALAMLLFGASEPPPILRNGFTTNADPPITVVNTVTNPVPVLITSNSIINLSSTNFELHSLSDLAQNILTNTSTIVANTPTNQIPVVTSGTNQVSFSFNATNICNNVTNAGVVGDCAWSVTNAAFTATGGSGLLQSMCLRSPTNQDLVLWVFSKVITAPTSGSTWAPTQDDLQYLVGHWDTTNTMWRAWQQAGTNWVKDVDRLSKPVQNVDASKNLHIIATYLDTKSNYTANASYITTGFINEK